MQFDILGEMNPGSWFDLEGGGRICLRVCSGDALRDITKKTVKKRTEYKKIDNILQRFPIEDVNSDLQSEMIWDYCIVDWDNFFDKENTPIPCTKENKLLLMGKSVMFSKFVGDCLEELRKQIEGDVEMEEEETEKN